MPKLVKKFYILIFVLIIVLVGGFFINQKFDKKVDSLPSISPSPAVSSPSPEISPSPSPTQAKKTDGIPSSYLIKNFPFQPQAPFANWDQLHDEACEEAAVILVQWWSKNHSTISAQTMDNEIIKMVDWQIKDLGSHKDLTVKETAQMAKSIYGLELTPKYNIDIDDIKRAVSENHPVIVPTAGRLLGNPYFRSPGPIYHMVVVIGYEGKTMIVQDVGTRRGENYKYNQEIFYNAIHDWAGSKDNITSGRKAMLIF